MYERFLSAPNLPLGAVLSHILKREGMSQRELSGRTSILPQRINDYISGRRRITPEVSFKLELPFDLPCHGYFYLIQSHHDIYLAGKSLPQATPDMTRIRKGVFWDTDLKALDWDGNRYSIIKRVFEYGDDMTINEIVRFYGHSVVREVLESCQEDRLAFIRQRNINDYLP